MSDDKDEEYYRSVTDPQKIKTLNEYHAYDKKIRGEFLVYANWIEDIMEQIIAKLLIGEDKEKDKFIIFILRKIPYDTKAALLSRSMKKFAPELNLEKLNVISDLTIVKKIRNIYAHSLMDLRDDFLESHQNDVVQFEVKRDGETEYVKFTKKELKNYQDVAGNLLHNLIEIDTQLHNKYKNNK